MMHTASNAADSFQCAKCPTGRITTSPNTLTTCVPCGPGEYQDEVGQFKCKACTPGKWSNAMSLSVESGCHNCTAGKYSKPKGADSIEACVDCPPGRKGDVTKTGANDAKFCTECNAAKYSGESGRTSCNLVKSGYYRSGPTAVAVCPAGKFGDGCQDCVQGQYRNGSDPIATSCRDCDAGYYTNDVGQATCFPCIPVSFSYPSFPLYVALKII